MGSISESPILRWRVGLRLIRLVVLGLVRPRCAALAVVLSSEIACLLLEGSHIALLVLCYDEQVVEVRLVSVKKRQNAAVSMLSAVYGKFMMVISDSSKSIITPYTAIIWA